MSSPEPGDLARLIGVAEAIKIIDAVDVLPRTIRLPLVDAEGRRLAADIFADRDYPPFPKSIMDGYAVRVADVRNAASPLILRVVGEVAAGAEAATGVGPGEAMAIMTGAPMPDGADGVIPIEDVAPPTDGATIRINRTGPPGRYVAAKGSDCPAGRLVISKGTILGPAQLGAAATVGARDVEVFEKPRVAVLGTGNELVPFDQEPHGPQIRNSNSIMLIALLRRLGCDVTDLGVARDEPDAIRSKLQEGFAFDALFVTGGMSMGRHDHVPRLLVELGAELKISKLRIKPGKPFVFGVVGEGEGTEARRHEGTKAKEDIVDSNSCPGAPFMPSCLRASVPSSSTFLFGLPGNPVAAFVCTVRLASRLIDRMSGGQVNERWVTGRLISGLPVNGPREFYQPVVRTDPPGRVSAQTNLPAIKLLTWKGSADIFTLAGATALLIRGENEPAVPEGTLVRVLEI